MEDLGYPQFPLSRLITEGTIGDCPSCGSTTLKKWKWFGEKIGCIQPECENYYHNVSRMREIKLKKLGI